MDIKIAQAFEQYKTIVKMIFEAYSGELKKLQDILEGVKSKEKQHVGTTK